MRVIEHFKVYQALPILIDDVASFIVDECGYVENIKWHPTKEDGEYLSGMLYRAQYS